MRSAVCDAAGARAPTLPECYAWEYAVYHYLPVSKLPSVTLVTP